MKRIWIVLPLAVMLANCSSSHKTGLSSTTGTNASTATGTSTSTDMSTTASASMGTTSDSGSVSTGAIGSTSASWNGASSLGVPNPNSGYDPNNFMQNPDKYLAPYLLTKTGGWTYSNDWRRNTNFSPEADGNWQLVLTPEVEASWIKDTSRPETYASYWTPEAVAARREILMAAARKSADSIRTIDSLAELANATARSTKKAGKYGRKKAGVTASASAETNTAVSGSGTTGAMGTGGLTTSDSATTDAATAAQGANATTDATSTGTTAASATSYLTAVNGNNFMMPAVSLHIGNGSFTAYTGCNNALGTLTVDGNRLHFVQATPATNIQCIGGFDQSAFLDRLSRADNYDMVNNQIRLKQGEQVLMVFGKSGM